MITTKMRHFVFYLFPLLIISCVGTDNPRIQHDLVQDYLYISDSSNLDIPYKLYNSQFDTIKGAWVYDENNKPEAYEPTFAERYLKNRQIDTSGKVLITKAITAREIVKCLIIDKYGVEKLKKIKNFEVILVDNKFWCIIFSLNKNVFGGTNVILISKYNGKILEWSNLK